MAILIENMNVIPKSCNRCSLRSVYDRCGAHEYGAEDPKVLLHCVNETKPEWCPLKELVLCGKCKHWYSDADTGMACEYTNMSQPEDGFCNWGERK